jgi:hypothetical protein
VEPQSQGGYIREEKILFPLPGIETWCLGWPPCSLVSILTLLWIKLSTFELPNGYWQKRSSRLNNMLCFWLDVQNEICSSSSSNSSNSIILINLPLHTNWIVCM